VKNNHPATQHDLYVIRSDGSTIATELLLFAVVWVAVLVNSLVPGSKSMPMVGTRSHSKRGFMNVV
jgi:hypothetical protein